MGELTDLAFTILGKLGRYYNIQAQRVCFIFWGACMVYWIARNYELGLISQTAGCVVSLGFHIWGYINWKKQGIGK